MKQMKDECSICGKPPQKAEISIVKLGVQEQFQTTLSNHYLSGADVMTS